ncbi:MAG: hypothetical protein E7262_02755 [Lachnospiraceae bacterium]|nr:hypothetical protein [Lachnospiraceae bacterium]
MKVNAAGIKLIKTYMREYGYVKGGLSYDAIDVWDSAECEQQRKEEFEKKFDEEIARYSVYVMRFCEFEANENQFSALVSFGYNNGVINLKKLLSGKTAIDVSNDILKFIKVNDKIQKNLVKLRKEEKKLFDKPVDTSYAVRLMDTKTSVRKGAGKKYDKTGSVFKKGEIVKILKTNSAKTYGLTNMGWVSLKYAIKV